MNEYEKLSKIADKVAEGLLPDRGEARWLVSSLRQALRGRPDEFIFPEYAALVLKPTSEMIKEGLCKPPPGGKFEPGEKVAYSLRLLAKVDWRNECNLGEGILAAQPSEGAKVFTRDAFCDSSDAFLVVRPYVRASSDTPAKAYEELRRCSLCMHIDDEEIVSQAPIDDYLIGPDGRSVRALSPQLFVRPESLTFQACELDEDRNAQMGQRIGAFVPRNSLITVVLSGPRVSGPIKIVAGVIAAHYTSRPVPVRGE